MPFYEEYTLLDELGQGGYATVYKVRHNNLGYIRAIRVLNAPIAHGEADKTYQKFLAECRLLLRLGNGNHPNIVHIYQPLLRNQKAIVEMDFVDGKNLFHYLEDHSSFVEIDDVLRLVSDIGSALAYCHEDIYKFCMDRDEDRLQDDPEDGSKILLDEPTRRRLINKYGVIHNDIHSGNIIRREDGSFVLLDFGLAIEGENVIRSSRRRNGAPEFKAPEKWDNESVLTTKTDIYSFGVVLYEYLAGRVPFLYDKTNSNPTVAEYELMKAHKELQPLPIYDLRKEAFERSHPGEKYQQDFPNWLENLILKCLEKDPEDRFASGKELYAYVREHMAKSADGREAEVNRLNSEIASLKNEVEMLRREAEVPPCPPVWGLDEERIKELKKKVDALSTLNATLANENKNLRGENEALKNLEPTSVGVSGVWRFMAILFFLLTAGVCVFGYFWAMPKYDRMTSEFEELRMEYDDLYDEYRVLKDEYEPESYSDYYDY